MFSVNQNYFMYSLNVSQRTSGLSQTPDDENFAKAFTGLIPSNVWAKSSVS